MTTKFHRTCVVHSSAQREGSAGDSTVSTYSALQQQQLEFCCLLCGYDVPCGTCPFNWFGFDPRKFRNQRRRSRQSDDPSKFAASATDIRQAMETLGIATSSSNLDQQQVKAAFRAKALQWHPDCNQEPEAEEIFKEILLAYELLLAHAR
ncbi:hypothetical protein PHYBOEH_004809 [Phytophthora boehmeriae]|uniref:J domain-containing protein n=1 Tax=Phytophthora boehmeriae TaxID=109152 RepID=A0A8T1WMS6_9STRA|nr:hypothetical protein PHYBOEH_004809 [Phytophthora boehmeriae]